MGRVGSGQGFPTLRSWWWRRGAQCVGDGCCLGTLLYSPFVGSESGLRIGLLFGGAVWVFGGVLFFTIDAVRNAVVKGVRGHVFLVTDVAYCELAFLGADFRAVAELEAVLALLRFWLVWVAPELEAAVVYSIGHVCAFEGDEYRFGLAHHASGEYWDIGFDVGDELVGGGERRDAVDDALAGVGGGRGVAGNGVVAICNGEFRGLQELFLGRGSVGVGDEDVLHVTDFEIRLFRFRWRKVGGGGYGIGEVGRLKFR